MNTNFDRIFSLAKKSKSRLVVFDKQEGEHFVVLGVDDFEALLDAPAASKPASSYEPEIPPTPVVTKLAPEQVIDSDRDQDALLLQKLNQQIADWRRDELEKAQNLAEAEAEDQAKAEKSVLLEQKLEVQTKPIQPVTIPVKIEPEPEAPVQPKSSGNWHKLGDVMASSSLAKVSYEPLGEQGIKPITQEEVNEYAEPEPLNDDPVFLEEPLG